ncbi:MAG: metallophosphoesterase [Rhodopirellula sp.]|nr:metallophosphoesterase [Rhodopirellula sp.]
MRASTPYWIMLPGVVFLSCGLAKAVDRPLARIAVISNPYLTTLPASEIKDESGALRDFLAKTGPDSMEKTVALVNSLKPDAFVVLGSLTWSGSNEDLAAFSTYLNQINAPKYTVPGHRDRLSGSLDGYRRVFGKHDAQDSLKTINGVHLGFTSDLHLDPAAATDRLEKQLTEAGGAKAMLLFDEVNRTMGRSMLTPTHEKFWGLVERHHVAAKFSPTRYGHALGYTNTLPTWTVGSTAWSTRGAVTLIKVFEDRVEIAEVNDPASTTFSLTIPNPVTTPRMPPVDADPFACPSFSDDLKQQPDFTFAIISDPQFDRETNRDTLIQKAEATIRDLNRLNPAFVLVAGDLVNNNLPEEWELFNRIFAELKPPKHVVPGNHDVLFNYDFIEASYSTAPEKKPEYAKIVQQALADAEQEGFTGPTALYEKYTGTRPRQRIEHGDCAFITVPFLTMRADPEQIKFLKEQLEQTREKQHVFVVAHYPSLPAFGNNVQPQLGGTEVISLLHEHRVTGYLFGHRHRNGFRMHERTAHVLSDNCGTIHLLHVFPDRVVVGRKTVGTPLYEKLTIPSPRG